MLDQGTGFRDEGNLNEKILNCCFCSLSGINHVLDLTVLILYSDSCFRLDGLVKRLEELERTAELYKGKLCHPSDTRWERKIVMLCLCYVSVK